MAKKYQQKLDISFPKCLRNGSITGNCVRTAVIIEALYKCVCNIWGRFVLSAIDLTNSRAGAWKEHKRMSHTSRL